MALICSNLSCIRGDRPIFANLSFCMPQDGGLLLLKGHNGTGKTSLLKMLAGLLPITDGSIEWRGEPIAGNSGYLRELIFIGHKSAVKEECTVIENLHFWSKLYQTEMLIPAALNFFGLTRFQNTLCSELSAGWQRRVALARLIVAPHKIWLLDEPTNFLDEDAVALTGALIESRVQQGGIVISASHIMQSSFGAHKLEMQDFS